MNRLRKYNLCFLIAVILVSVMVTLAACGEKTVLSPSIETPSSGTNASETQPSETQPSETQPSDPGPEEPEEELFTVTFVVNGKVTTVEVLSGDLPIFEGDLLIPSDETNTYRFAGWDKEIVAATEKTTYTAVYEILPLITYKVNWKFSGKTYTTDVAEGHIPSPPSLFTEKYQTAAESYTFEKWDKEFKLLTPEYVEENEGEVSFEALYTSVARKYNVTYTYRGNTLATVEAEYGSRPSLPEDVKITPPAGYNAVAFPGNYEEVKKDVTLEGKAVMLDPAQIEYALSQYTIGFREDGNDSNGAIFAEASGLLYLTMEVRASLAAGHDLEGDTKYFYDDVLSQLKNFVGEKGQGPFFDLAPYWSYVPVTAAIAVCHDTPVIWDSLTAEEKEEYDFIMECFAYVLALGTDDDNDYKTGPGLTGKFGKKYNPNYRLSSVTPMLFIGKYFGGAANVNLLLNNFSYDTTVAKFQQYGLDRAYRQWTVDAPIIGTNQDGSPIYGPSVKEFMENGGAVYLKSRNDYNDEYLSTVIEGSEGGSGKGVRTDYTYKGYDIDSVSEILYELLAYNYSGGNVINKCCLDPESGEYRAYIADGSSSPYLGKPGLMLELGLENRSSGTYASHDFKMIAITLAAMLELDMYDIEDESNIDIFRLAWIGNADFIYKYEVGYMSWAESRGKDSPSYLTKESTSDAYFVWKSWWQSKYGHYTPETLPKSLTVKDEDFESLNVYANSDANKTLGGIEYITKDQTGVLFSTQGNESNKYLQIKQDAGAKGPTFNFRASGGLAGTMGSDHTSIKFKMDLAVPQGVSSSTAIFRLRGVGGSQDTVPLVKIEGGNVKLNNQKSLGALTSEFQTLEITVDFANGTMTGRLGSGEESTVNFSIPPSSATSATTHTEWLATATGYIFNAFVDKNDGAYEKQLLLDNLYIAVLPK